MRCFNVKATLGRWSLDSDKPLVLLIDEIDSLVGDTLISVRGNIRISNRIYQEVIPWELTYSSQGTITHDNAAT